MVRLLRPDGRRSRPASIPPSRTRTGRSRAGWCTGLVAAVLVAAVLVALGHAPAAWAQEFPNRPVRIIVPFSPGGAVDGPTRVIAQELGRRLGQPVVVENRPGAGATIGSEVAANAPPDGYTLLLASQTNAIAASLYSKLNFNPVDDFVPISLLGREPGVLVVNPGFPAKSVAELIDHVKARPGQVNYASSGNGSGQHLFMAMFASMAGLKMVHLPYRGSGPATTDLLSGQVPMSIPGTAAMMVHIRAGKLRALATTGSQRSKQLPDVPTLAESGIAGYSAYVWMGLLAPKATPTAIVERLNRELKATLAVPEVRQHLDDAGIEIVGSTPDEFGAFFREERDRWSRVVKETGARVD